MIDIILSIMKELNMKLVTVIVECDSDGGDGYGSVNLMMNVMIEIQGDFYRTHVTLGSDLWVRMSVLN